MGNVTRKTVIRQCLDWLNWPDWMNCVLDYRTPKLTCFAAVTLLVEAQLAGRPDPESVVEHLRASEELQSLTKLSSISASQLSRKLRALPTWLLQYLFHELNQRVMQRLQSQNTSFSTAKKSKNLSLIDSTTIPLPEKLGKWAYYRRSSHGVKMHLRLSTEWPDLSVPSKFKLTTGAVSDSEMAVELVKEPGTTYVMDRGYINYSHFRKWKEAGISFVVRLQKRNKVEVLDQRPTPADDPKLLLDADVKITSTKEPEQPVTLRLVEFKDEKGRLYRLVTTRWDVTAREIADMYRDRWGIELFFKWMKQKLHLTQLYSYQETAVWNQIYLALIANALCALVKLETQYPRARSRMWKLIVEYLDDEWEDFLSALFRPPTRTSKGRQKKAKKGRPRKRPEQPKSTKMVVEDEFN